jgi:hypothetical protein
VHYYLFICLLGLRFRVHSGGANTFNSDAWWLEHYTIGSRPEEDLLSDGSDSTRSLSRCKSKVNLLLLPVTTGALAFNPKGGFTNASRALQYKSLCNPKLWRWRLLHSNDKEEITGVLLLNVGAHERVANEQDLNFSLPLANMLCVCVCVCGVSGAAGRGGVLARSADQGRLAVPQPRHERRRHLA